MERAKQQQQSQPQSPAIKQENTTPNNNNNNSTNNNNNNNNTNSKEKPKQVEESRRKFVPTSSIRLLGFSGLGGWLVVLNLLGARTGTEVGFSGADLGSPTPSASYIGGRYGTLLLLRDLDFVCSCLIWWVVTCEAICFVWVMVWDRKLVKINVTTVFK